jgi:hypothetical protein
MPGAPVFDGVSTEQASEAQFSAYYPPQVKPRVSYGLYVYAHTPDALQAIRENVERFKERLGGDVPDATTAAQHAMLRLGTELTAVPQANHVKFTPAQQVRTWVGDWTRFDFDFTPDVGVTGTLDVRVSIQVAGFEIAHIPCQMQVNAAEAVSVRSINPLLDARLRAVTARMYNRIFISYSRRDLPVANAYRLAQQAAGNDVFMDSYSIRAGEDWQAALARAIDEADVFQLFWSRNSADSPNVRDEYTYALHQRCPNDRCVTFIRPVFWEEPLVPPPNELGHLNFRFVALPDDVREATPQAADSETTLVRLASMESRLSAIEASLEAIKQAVLGLANPKQ